MAVPIPFGAIVNAVKWVARCFAPPKLALSFSTQDHGSVLVGELHNIGQDDISELKVVKYQTSKGVVIPISVDQFYLEGPNSWLRERPVKLEYLKVGQTAYFMCPIVDELGKFSVKIEGKSIRNQRPVKLEVTRVVIMRAPH